MATHLVHSGHKVHGFDVFPASVQRFAAAGGIPAASLRESAERKGFYICMVASAPQAEEALFGENGVVQCMYASFNLHHPGLCSAYIYIYIYIYAHGDEQLANKARPSTKRNPHPLLHRPSLVCSICGKHPCGPQPRRYLACRQPCFGRNDPRCGWHAIPYGGRVG